MNRDQRSSFVIALLRWYAAHHRPMPWRARPGSLPDPYHVLVSEAMLQQTQVATVISYFERFLAQFPTIAALAAADEQRVLRCWQGLGYYRRARNLHAAARAIVEQHGGVIPDSLDSLLALPGVGPYTAGAIASIGFGKVEPVVDGNVNRVLARVGAVEEAVDGPAGRRRIWAAARELVEAAAEQRAFTTGDFNQALMELGATVCVPTGPMCGQCPVSGWCEARRLNRVGEFPVVLPRKKAREVRHEVVAIRRGGRWLLVRRGESGLWAGMWQLPTCEEPGCDLAAWLKQATGLVCDISPGALLGSFTHVTTHRRITFRVWIAAMVKGRLRAGAGVWRGLDEVDDLPLSKAQQRVVEMVRAAERSEALVVDEG